MFKAYDIRGTFKKDFNAIDFKKLGVALGKWMLKKGYSSVCVGNDTRESGAELTNALLLGLSSCDIEVFVQDHIITPMNIWSMKYLDVDVSAMITASHNPWEDNGLKLYINNKNHVKPVCGDELKELELYMEDVDCRSYSNKIKKIDLTDEYIAWLPKIASEEVAEKIVWNANYGGASRILKKLGCVVNLWSENCYSKQPQGPDALLNGIGELILSVDGDGDRLRVTYKNRNLTAEEIMLALPAKKIVHDVHLSSVARSMCGAQLIESRVGHVFVQKAMLEHNVDLGFEASGHFFFKELGTADDALYAGINFVNNISNIRYVNAFVSEIIRVNSNNSAEKLKKIEENFDGRTIVKTDGLRLIYDQGWILIRQSNTQTCLSIMFEGKNEKGFKFLETKLESMLG